MVKLLLSEALLVQLLNNCVSENEAKLKYHCLVEGNHLGVFRELRYFNDSYSYIGLDKDKSLLQDKLKLRDGLVSRNEAHKQRSRELSERLKHMPVFKKDGEPTKKEIKQMIQDELDLISEENVVLLDQEISELQRKIENPEDYYNKQVSRTTTKYLYLVFEWDFDINHKDKEAQQLFMTVDDLVLASEDKLFEKYATQENADKGMLYPFEVLDKVPTSTNGVLLKACLKGEEGTKLIEKINESVAKNHPEVKMKVFSDAASDFKKLKFTDDATLEKFIRLR